MLALSLYQIQHSTQVFETMHEIREQSSRAQGCEGLSERGSAVVVVGNIAVETEGHRGVRLELQFLKLAVELAGLDVECCRRTYRQHDACDCDEQAETNNQVHVLERSRLDAVLRALLSYPHMIIRFQSAKGGQSGV